jgi:WD40 repeat protein
VQLWTLADLTQQASLLGHAYSVRSLAFSPGGEILASVGDDAQIRCWDPHTGTLHKVFVEHSDRVWSAAFSPDGATLATASSDRTVRLTGMSDVVQRVSLPPCAGSAPAAFLPDSTTLVRPAGGSRIGFWNTDTGELRSCLQVEHPVRYLAVARARLLLAVTTTNNTIELYDLADANRHLMSIPQETVVGQPVLSPDGTLLAWPLWLDDAHGGYSVVRVLDLRSGKTVLSQTTRRTLLCAFTGDGSSLVMVFDNRCHRLDVATRRLHGTPLPPQDNPQYLAVSPENKIVAIGRGDRSIRLFDSETGQELFSLLGHREYPAALAFSPDGRTLASGSAAGEVVLWDVFTGHELARLDGHSGSVTGLAFSADGARLAATREGTGQLGEVTIWHARKRNHD